MPVVLRQSTDLPGEGSFERWCAAGAAGAGPDVSPKVEDLAGRLEGAFEAIRERWWELGRLLSVTPSAELAHMPTCGTYSSDFGVMLAWARLVDVLAAATPSTLVVCDDPWLFRHLAARPGVSAGKPPGLWIKTMTLRLRGFLARCRATARLVATALATRCIKATRGTGEAVLIVFGHPDSGAGTDAYFGGLMKEMPELERLTHTDCPAARALELGSDGRTASLHAWGAPLKALGLPFARWRPSSQDLSHPEGWLIRRAAEVEGSGGSGAMNRWQFDCQEAWLAAVRPAAIAWPWENHPWERALVREARKRGIRTVGHQHTVIGPHMFNQSPASNPDGIDGLPDNIVCDGPGGKVSTKVDRSASLLPSSIRAVLGVPTVSPTRSHRSVTVRIRSFGRSSVTSTRTASCDVGCAGSTRNDSSNGWVGVPKVVFSSPGVPASSPLRSSELRQLCGSPAAVHGLERSSVGL